MANFIGFTEYPYFFKTFLNIPRHNSKNKAVLTQFLYLIYHYMNPIFIICKK